MGCAELRLRGRGAADGVVVQPRAMALLTYLALGDPGPFHSRDTVMAMFWPDLDQEHARNALNQSVHRLRRILGADVLASRGRDTIYLAANRYRCDAREFDRAIRSGRLEEALDLYRGPLLDGFFISNAAGFERWLEEERERLRLAAFRAARSLAEAELAGGREDAGIGWLERALTLRPEDEDTARELVVTLARIGDRAGALAARDSFVRRIGEEYDLEPSAEFQTTVDAALSSTAARAAVPRSTTPSAGPADVQPTVLPDENVTPAKSRPRRHALVGALALMPALALVLLVRVAPPLATSPASAADDSIARIAVPPFAVRGADSLDLAETLSFLVSGNLDGAGTLRAVDPYVVQSALLAAANSEDSEADTAMRLGASYTVRGTAVAAGGRLRLDAAVHRAGEDRERVAHASVVGAETELIQLTEQLASELIASWSGEPGGELRGAAARTTHSLSALKLYLQGERARRAADLPAAVHAFREAVAQDSSFALAHYRLSVAAGWTPQPELAATAIRAAFRHARHLPERYRLLLEARLAYEEARATDAEQIYRTILTLYPDEAEAWYGLGETLYHFNRLRGRLQSEAWDPLWRALRLDPEHGDAIHHLLDLAVYEGRAAEHDSLVALLRARLAREPELPLEMRVRLALGHGIQLGGDSAQLSRELRAADDARLTIAFFALATGPDERLFADSILALMTQSGRTAETRALGYLFIAHRAVSAGRWQQAFAELTRLEQLRPDIALELRAVFSLLPFSPVSESDVYALRARLLEWDAVDPPHVREPLAGMFLNVHTGVRPELRRYFLGMVAARLRDTTQLAVFADSLAHSAQPPAGPRARLAADLARGLRAELEWLRGEPAAALAALGPLIIEEPQPLTATSYVYARAFQRFRAAELLRALGRRDEALLRYATLHGVDTGIERPFRAVAELRQAQLLHAAGHHVRAIARYSQFLDVWRDADPGLLPLLQEGRRGLETLRMRGRIPPPGAP
ncbi:MAG TPA: BTAD domain-containing putative transcriptional regulator [Longimicrobiales bacterium]